MPCWPPKARRCGRETLARQRRRRGRRLPRHGGRVYCRARGDACRGHIPELASGHVDPLFALASAYRALFTVAGGYATARLAPDRPMRHVWILAGIGLVTGLAGVIAYYIIGGLNSARPRTRSRSPSRPSPASGGAPDWRSHIDLTNTHPGWIRRPSGSVGSDQCIRLSSRRAGAAGGLVM
jgi:hypothetical protein